MMFDLRPFLAWWADRKGRADPEFREGRKRVFISILCMLAALAVLPDWLAIGGFVAYWVIAVLRSPGRSESAAKEGAKGKEG